MGMIKFEVPHGLSKDDAKKRVEQLVDYWKRKYGVAVSWAGDAAKLSGKVMGISIDADLQISDKKVGGEATDPGLLLRGQAKSYLTRKFQAYLDPNKKPGDVED